MNEDLRHWLEEDHYDGQDVALLLAGIDPYKAGKELNEPTSPASASWLQTAKDKNLIGWEKAFFHYQQLQVSVRKDEIEDYEIGVFDRGSVVKWAQSRGYEFPLGCNIPSTTDQTIQYPPVEKLLTPNHPCYAEELAIAIKTWLQLVRGKVKPGSTPKQDALEILESRLKGKNDKSKRERIATVVNWDKDGGAPCTPVARKAVAEPNPIHP